MHLQLTIPDHGSTYGAILTPYRIIYHLLNILPLVHAGTFRLHPYSNPPSRIWKTQYLNSLSDQVVTVPNVQEEYHALIYATTSASEITGPHQLRGEQHEKTRIVPDDPNAPAQSHFFNTPQMNGRESQWKSQIEATGDTTEIVRRRRHRPQ